MTNIEEWHKIGYRLAYYLDICGCQRKLKSIVDILVHIDIKISNQDWKALKAEELLITALLEKRGLLAHGTNCEYPIKSAQKFSINFWNFIHEIKDSPYLEDN